MDEQKKILIIFTEKADIVLSDIIKKYSLQETDLETLEKYKAGKLPKIVIIDNLTRDFTLKIISEKDLIASLQKELEISQQTAEQISKEIINNLVPLLDKISEDQLENYNLKDQPQPDSSNVAFPETDKKSFMTIEEKLKTGPIIAETETIETPKIPKKIKKELPEKKINIQQKGPDSYREPIE